MLYRIAALLLLLSGACAAQDAKVTRRKFVVVTSVAALATVADIEASQYGLHHVRGVRERNPLVHTTRGRIYAVDVPLQLGALYAFTGVFARKRYHGWWVLSAFYTAIHARGVWSAARYY